MATLSFEVGDKVRHTAAHTPWVGVVSDVKPAMPYPYYVQWERTDALKEKFKNEFGPFTGVHKAVELRKRKGLGD